MRRVLVIVILLISAVAVAALFDKNVAGTVHYSQWPQRIRSRGEMVHVLRIIKIPRALYTHPMSAATPLVAWVIKFPGVFYFTLAVAALISLIHPLRWRAGAILCLSGIAAGLFYSIVKWIVGRTRPYAPTNGPWTDAFHFQPFIHGWHGLIKAENLSFPSGHTCLAFASAAVLSDLFPRYRVMFFIIAALTAIERVIECAHYPSDVIGGAALGLLAALATEKLLHPRSAAGNGKPPAQLLNVEG